jgi:2,4-dienoyl-CoA reductase (NADPH2)
MKDLPIGYPSLSSKFPIGPFTLRNRLVMAPFVTGMEGSPNIIAIRDFYEKRAAGGASMVTVSEAIVDNGGRRFSREHAFTEEDVAIHRPIVKAIHKHGSLAILQLEHLGIDADVKVAISSVSAQSRLTGRHGWPARNGELNHIVNLYGSVTLHAIDALYDGVEIDGSGAGLIADFLSPLTNRRTDQWGRTQLSRFKLALDVVRSVRKAIGEHRLIGFRLNLYEVHAKGADWAEIKRLIQMLRMAGVDYLACDFGNRYVPMPTKGYSVAPGAFFDDYMALSEIAEMPVIFGKELASMEKMEAIAAMNDTALFEVAEPLIADPEFINKSLFGDDDSVNACTRCMIGCVKNSYHSKGPISCIVNPYLFESREALERPADIPKNIAVVGSGIAGIMFSLTAARRGHKVTLFEKNEQIGGMLRMMGRIPGRELFLPWLERLEQELLSLGVVINRSTTATKDLLLQDDRFDEFVFATGARPRVPDIDGIDSSNVLTYEELLADQMAVGDRIAVLGTNTIGLAVARYLACGQREAAFQDVQTWRNAWGIGSVKENKGGVLGVIPDIAPPVRQVYLMERNDEETKQLLVIHSKLCDWKWLRMKGVQMFRGVNFELIDNYSIHVSRGENHRDPITIPVTHVVVCWDRTPDRSLFFALLTAGKHAHTIGTCAEDSMNRNLVSIANEARLLAMKL